MTTATTTRQGAPPLLLLCAGLCVWGSAFLWLYAALSVGCAFGWDGMRLGPLSLQRGVLLGIWVLHVLALLGIIVWCRRHARRVGRRPDGLLARAALYASVVALVATLVNYAPVLALSTCL